MGIPTKRLSFILTLILAGLAVVLIGYGIIRATTSLRLPERLDTELPNFVILAALAVFFYNRKLRADAAKAAAARAAAEKAAAASEGKTADEATGTGEGGGDGGPRN